MVTGSLDGIEWAGTEHDPGILSPFRADQRSFARIVEGGPFYRPISFPWKRNPWKEWRWHTIYRERMSMGFMAIRFWKLMVYFGAKVYTIGENHTYAKPEHIGKAAITWSFRVGWEPFS